MNKLIALSLVVILLVGIVSVTNLHTDAEAKKKVYKYKVTVTIKGEDAKIAEFLDEVYFRISSDVKNPNNNNNHDQLVVKGEKEHIDKAQTVTFSGTFDPVKFQKKYGTPLKNLREYIEAYKNHVEVHDEYKKLVPFDLKRTSYSWSHSITVS